MIKQKISFLITYIVPVATLAATIWIPIKIKWEQEYSSLLDFYRSLDYAIAFQGVIQFFFNDCGRDMSRVTNDFTNAEAKLLKILIHMGQAIDSDPLLYKDISSDALSPKPARLKGQNKSLGQLCQILKQSKRFMDGQ